MIIVESCAYEAPMPKHSLNLSLEEVVFERARRYAQRHGTSISALVAAFLAALPESREGDGLEEEALTPAVRRLVGIGAGPTDEEAYRRHLLEKHAP